MSSTLKAAIDAPPDTFIDGAFEANVSNASTFNTKTGRPMFKATLSDGGLSVDAASMSQTFEHMNGKRVRFYGKGIKRSPDYSGKPQVFFGQTAKHSIVGGGAPSEAPASNSPAPAQAAPQGRSFSQRMDDMQLFFQHCYVRANNFAAAHGLDSDNEAIRNVATTFFIQGQKEGLHVNPPALT